MKKDSWTSQIMESLSKSKLLQNAPIDSQFLQDLYNDQTSCLCSSASVQENYARIVQDIFSPAEIHLDEVGQNLPEIFSLPTTIIGTVYNNDFNNTWKVSKTTEHLIL